ncbi:MAG TPA: cupin domain-containing protein [Gemmatimonadales bacterium]|jgi:glc operon protein GlcG|nr:cupin domain-containing protein [Gemmatimonadales bacterium]
MRSALLAAMTVLAALPLGVARAQSDDASVRYIGHDDVTAAFARGKPMIEVGDYKIHASRREGAGLVEVHTRDTDIAYVLQGSATLVTGGTAIGLKEIGTEEFRGSAIDGGDTRQLNPGDVVVIPNGTPHWFKQVKAPFLYYVVKVRQADRQTTAGAM